MGFTLILFTYHMQLKENDHIIIVRWKSSRYIHLVCVDDYLWIDIRSGFCDIVNNIFLRFLLDDLNLKRCNLNYLLLLSSDQYIQDKPDSLTKSTHNRNCCTLKLEIWHKSFFHNVRTKNGHWVIQHGWLYLKFSHFWILE